MVYWLRAAVPWRDLPPCYGSWNTVYKYWRILNSEGLVARIHAHVAKPRGRLRLIDATFIKVHQHAANWSGDPRTRGIGKTKGGRTTKLHAVVDEFGTLVAIVLTAGNVNDCKAAPDLLTDQTYKTVLADKAYDTNALRDLIKEAHSTACIPSCSRRKVALPYDADLYKLRHVVENSFQKLKVFRTIDTRYQKLLELVEGAVLFGALLLHLGYEAGSR